VPDLREDERGFHDAAYPGRADGDVPAAPAFLEEDEAAFALAAEAAKHAAAAGAGIEVTFARLSHPPAGLGTRPFPVPSSSRWLFRRSETLSTSWSGTSRAAR